MKKEAEEEIETANKETESKAEPEVIAEEKEDVDELDKSEESLMLVDKVEDEKMEEEGTDVVDVNFCFLFYYARHSESS